MIDSTIFLEFFSSWPPELTVALLAALPITELRGALPIAIFVFHLPPAAAYIWTVLGNLIPILLVFGLLPPFMRFVLRYVPRLNRCLEAYFEKLMSKHGEKYSAWGAFFLFLFVAIPLPATGVWTGSVLAVLFRIRRTLAIVYIVVGLLVAGLIVLAISQGVFTGITLL